jgi:hypothetical protein
MVFVAIFTYLHPVRWKKARRTCIPAAASSKPHDHGRRGAPLTEDERRRLLVIVRDRADAGRVAIVPFVGVESATLKVSFGSNTLSPFTSTVTGSGVSPVAKESVPVFPA